MRQMFQHQPTLLQLDARLNLGMSGGAVVNLKGELVGISTTGGNAEGFDAQAGYAIPVDAMGRRVIDTLRQVLFRSTSLYPTACSACRP